MKRLLALPAALIVALLVAGPVGAWPSGSLNVETNGCSYTLHVTLQAPGTLVGWEVRTYASVALSGDLVNSGSGHADANGNVDFGPFPAAAGKYNAIFGYTVPVTSDSEAIAFTLSCETATPTPTATPTATPTEKPTTMPTPTPTATPTEKPTPTPTEAPRPTATPTEQPTSTPTAAPTATPTATATFGGGVGNTTGGGTGTTTGGGVGTTSGGVTVTPPPTDTGSAAMPVASDRSALLVLAGLATLILVLAFTVPARIGRHTGGTDRARR